MTELDDSITHWERLRDAVEKGDWAEAMSEGWHADQCALCSEIVIPWAASTRIQNGCKGCPVASLTGRKGCVDTPYRKASERLYAWCYMMPMSPKIREQYRMKALDAVYEELNFLRSLRGAE